MHKSSANLSCDMFFFSLNSFSLISQNFNLSLTQLYHCGIVKLSHFGILAIQGVFFIVTKIYDLNDVAYTKTAPLFTNDKNICYNMGELIKNKKGVGNYEPKLFYF